MPIAKTMHSNGLNIISDLENYTSCALDFATGDGCLIQFKYQTSVQSSELKCKQDCFNRGFQFSVWYNKYQCLCGDEKVSADGYNIVTGLNVTYIGFSFPEVSPWCSCETSTMYNLHTDHWHCAKFYISGAIPALPTVKLSPLNIVSTGENVLFSVEVDMSIGSYCWDFADGTNLCVQNDTSVNHNFAFAGTYTISLTLAEDNGTFVINFPVTVQSEVKVSELTLDSYADVERELPLHVEIISGSGTQVQWSRHRVEDSTEYGMLLR